MPLMVPQIHSPTCRRVPTGLRFELRHYQAALPPLPPAWGPDARRREFASLESSYGERRREVRGGV